MKRFGGFKVTKVQRELLRGKRLVSSEYEVNELFVPYVSYMLVYVIAYSSRREQRHHRAWQEVSIFMRES